MKRLARRIAVLAAAITVMITTLAAPASASYPNLAIALLPYSLNQCITTSSAGGASLASCVFSQGESWTFTTVTGGYTISSDSTGKCITAYGVGLAVSLDPCNGAVIQRWTISTNLSNTRITSAFYAGSLKAVPGVGNRVMLASDTPSNWSLSL